MERDVWRYCNEFDICQRTNAPTHAKHGLLHALEVTCKPWTYISMDFITDLQESKEATMILVVVDQFTKMAQFMTLKKNYLLTVPRGYLDNLC